MSSSTVWPVRSLTDWDKVANPFESFEEVELRSICEVAPWTAAPACPATAWSEFVRDLEERVE